MKHLKELGNAVKNLSFSMPVKDPKGNIWNHIVGVYVFAGDDECNVTDGLFVEQKKMLLANCCFNTEHIKKCASRLRGEPMVAIVLYSEETDSLFTEITHHHKGIVYKSRVAL